MNYRFFVAKKEGFRIESKSLLNELKDMLGLEGLKDLLIYNIYDVFDASESDLTKLKEGIIADVLTDEIVDNPYTEGMKYIAYESLPVQYDQRADAVMQNLMILGGDTGVKVTSGKLIVLDGELADDEIESIKKYLVNPVENRIKNMDILEYEEMPEEDPVVSFEGFIEKDEAELENFRNKMGFAMSREDLFHVQKYFKSEDRNPTDTELLVLDTYWSDHCRHTTFETELVKIDIEDGKFKSQIEDAFNRYLKLREETNRTEKEVTLMDMATIVGRYFRNTGKLDDQEVSDEINACSVEIEVDEDGVKVPWLLMFKNETHNHPTEIEPFGGAATCVGGAIRDPLSGRAYVYQAMRVTGAGDITSPISETIENKLPQVVISKTASDGYSNYAGQIGLAGTYVREVYHDGFVAKRMELGAVVGAAPKENVTRANPEPSDLILLIGGDTGRDGVGGATGSSVEHTDSSHKKSSSEVQKGNAPIERRIQRLFRKPEFSKLIKKSNDFGAGGVSVAIGELADGLDINLNAVPVKYRGLSGTELAISESQERMAIVIAKENLEKMIELAKGENLNAVLVAEVTDTNRLVIRYNDEKIVDISRDFLNTNGVRQTQSVDIHTDGYGENPFESDREKEANSENLLNNLKQLNTALQKGMIEKFDSTIGRSTVHMPFGGKYQLTESDVSIQKLPTDGFTNTASAMAVGYNPNIAAYSPYLGGMYSVVEALAKLVSIGVDYKGARLTNQEYFERLGEDSEKWGKPAQALLGLLKAQLEMDTPSIGGKDSMSGTFNEIDVPPTLITFAINTVDANMVISPEFKSAGNRIYLLKTKVDENYEPDFSDLKTGYDAIINEINHGSIVAASVVKYGGIAEAVAKMSFGNKIGAEVTTVEAPFSIMPGSIIFESKVELDGNLFTEIGRTTDSDELVINGASVKIDEAISASMELFEGIYPTAVEMEPQVLDTPLYEAKEKATTEKVVESPKVIVPIVPGTNSEYDVIKAFEREGAEVETFILNTLTETEYEDSVKKLGDAIGNSNILALVGGFANGDEPDGCAVLLTNVLKHKYVRQGVEKLLANDGLILGISNGFQALAKTGLIPFGEYTDADNRVSIFKNNINRHVSKAVNTRVTSNKSPWMSSFKPGEVHTLAFSQGQGKVMINEELAKELIEKGQIAGQYVNESGEPTLCGRYNPSSSMYAIEAMTNEDGRILGKMGHSERYEEGLLRNIVGEKEQNIFKNAVEYFR